MGGYSTVVLVPSGIADVVKHLHAVLTPHSSYQDEPSSNPVRFDYWELADLGPDPAACAPSKPGAFAELIRSLTEDPGPVSVGMGDAVVEASEGMGDALVEYLEDVAQLSTEEHEHLLPRNTASVERLLTEPSPSALVTPDGHWLDSEDHREGWDEFYRQTLEEHLNQVGIHCYMHM